MNDVIEALTGAVAEACARHTTDPDAPAQLNLPLWDALDQIGVLGLGVDEEKGGSGGGLDEVVAVLGVLGENACAVPFAETGLAAWVLAEAGVPVPDGRLTIAFTDDLTVDGVEGDVTVSADLTRVPWADAAGHLVVLSPTSLVVVERDQYQVTSATNMAGEPRESVTLSGARVLQGRVWAVADGLPLASEQRLSVLRLAQMAGAARRALAQSVGYASERQQFGRAINKFQSVQHQLATLASEVLVCRTAAQSAALAVARGGDVTFALAAARVAAAQAAGVVARLAHQVHGAIGFTEEHTLRLSTTRLWAWRDENGAVRQHASTAGDLALQAGPDGLWDLLVGA